MVLSNYWAWEAKASDLRYCVKIIEQNSIILLIAEFNKYILLAVVIFFRIVTKSSWNQKKNLKLSEKVDNEAKTEKGTYKFHDRVMDIGTYITYLLIASLSIRVLKICICTIFTGNLRSLALVVGASNCCPTHPGSIPHGGVPAVSYPGDRKFSVGWSARLE
jgi:hypothetical protein